jgi:nitrite reductase (NO-forming)
MKHQTVVATEGEVKEFKLTGHMFYFQDEEGNENPDIRVNVGDTVRIVFDNVEGIHDWVIDEIEGAFTDLLQPGQSQTIEFTVTETGEFEYYCSYMQHREMGMFGRFIVE